MRTITIQQNESFDARIAGCIDRALAIIGASQREFLLHRLGMDYGLSPKNFVNEPEKLEKALKDILGDSVTTSVLSFAVNNIADSFQLRWSISTSLADTIEKARSKN